MQRLIAAFLAAQLLGGCSFAFVKGPPQNHRDLETVDCSTSNAAPIVDTLWTGLQTVNLFSAGTSSDEEWAASFDGEPPMSRSTAIPLYVGLALLGGASMIYGYSKASECRRAKAEAQERLARGHRAPNPDEEPPAPRAVRASGASRAATPVITPGPGPAAEPSAPGAGAPTAGAPTTPTVPSAVSPAGTPSTPGN